MSTEHALSLQEATRNSTAGWQRDLASLFQHAKERFPDVVWELSSDGGSVEEVWGHKAIVYARAPPSFQTRYFSFRPQAGSPLPATSAFSLELTRSPSPFRTASPAPSTTVGGLTRLTTSINPTLFSNELEYLYTGQGFGEAFEFLFDEQGGEVEGDAEELRIDKLRKDLVFMWRSRLYSDVRIALISNGPPPAGDPDDDSHERQMPVFSSHRFILASRSPYFHSALISWPQKPLSASVNGGEPLTLSLPSPPFTPASLHFTLGFIYTGTLIFSHRTYDLSTALALLLSANYLQLPALHTEVRARIVSEMAHGLFHAALPFAAYEDLTQGAWRAGGCTCRKCAVRIPRILEFALRPDVQDPVLERGARRGLVGLYGPGWCTAEFAALPPKLHAAALKGLLKRSTPANALPILFAAEAALTRLASLIDPWADVVRPLIEAGRKQIDGVLAAETAAVLAEKDWVSIMTADGVRFEDGERVEWACRSIVRGTAETNAGKVYQALVNVLLLPHPSPADDSTFPAQPLLSQTSHVRVQIEQARLDVLAWLKRGGRGRADRVAREGGLDGVDVWAIREIADHLEIPVDDLLSGIPAGSSLGHTKSASGARKSNALLAVNAAAGRDADAHSLSIHTQQSSMRVSVLSRSIPTPRATRTRAAAESDSQNTPTENLPEEEEEEAATEKDDDEEGERPDSKLTPELGEGSRRGLFLGDSGTLKGKGRANGTAPPSPIVAARRPPVPTRTLPESPTRSLSGVSTSTTSPSTAKGKSARPTVSVSVSPAPRPRSAASGTTASGHTPRPGSAASTSTVRTTRGTGLRPPPGSTTSARRASGASTSTSTLADFRTATARSRQSSISSVASKSGTSIRSRRASNASDVSVRTTGASGSGSAARPPVPPLDPSVRKRGGTPSIRSVRSTSGVSVTSTSTMDTAASAARKATLAVGRERRPEPKVITLKQRGRVTPAAKEKEKGKAKAKGDKEDEKEEHSTPATSAEEEKEREHRKTDSTASSASVSTLRVKRKGSGDTVSTVTTKGAAAPPLVREAISAAPKRPTPVATLMDLPQPRGAMLEIGIPCIISSKRKRFKALARYIGEVEGETGPWVGVEVPAGSADGLAGGRQWNDGTWAGIRYFEIGGAGSESEFGDEGRDRASRRRRLEGSGSFGGTQKGVKREGESLGGARGAKRIRSASPAVSDAGESRGLFVRPSAVLYVVGAVGADL